MVTRAPRSRSLLVLLLTLGCGGGEATSEPGPEPGARDAGEVDGALVDSGFVDGFVDVPDAGAGLEDARVADVGTADANDEGRARVVPVGDPQSSWVTRGADARLVYRATERGDRVPDFSSVGYRGSAVAIPDVAVVETVSPGAGDDSARIQAALDRVAGRPLGADGFRGAVLLTRGTYEVGETLRIEASGVVLRGEGRAADGTVLRVTGTTQREAIRIAGTGSLREVPGTRRAIANDYVPVGATWLQLEDASDLSVGDAVVVRRPATARWIRDIGMDRIVERAGTEQWQADAYHLTYEREVVAIDGDRVELDAPVMMAIDAVAYARGALYRSEFPGRIANVGVEALRLVSTYRAGEETSDEAHAWRGVQLASVEHAWVRDVVTMHFAFAGVDVTRSARFVTVQDCRNLDAVSRITGGRRYSFNVDGSRVLVQRTYAREGRHDYVTGSRVTGPNVFLDGVAERTHSDIGPHHRWATGVLYDNVRGGEIRVQDRGNLGTGHGWAGANHVFWNLEGERLVCQQPPTALNWCLGLIGPKVDGYLDRPDGQWELRGMHASPRSLFLAQLEDRLGREAVLAVARADQL